MSERWEPAAHPEELARFFVARANAGDVEGLVALDEPEAVVAFPSGQMTVGHAAIREVYTQFLATKLRLTLGTQLPTLHHGDLALTATRLIDGSVTVEVARRQPDGSWRWILDRPSFLA